MASLKTCIKPIQVNNWYRVCLDGKCWFNSLLMYSNSLLKSMCQSDLSKSLKSVGLTFYQFNYLFILAPNVKVKTIPKCIYFKVYQFSKCIYVHKKILSAWYSIIEYVSLHFSRKLQPVHVYIYSKVKTMTVCHTLKCEKLRLIKCLWCHGDNNSI